MEDFEQRINKLFEGYHVDIYFFPTGGTLSAVGCEGCGTTENSFNISWKIHRGQNLEWAIKELINKINMGG